MTNRIRKITFQDKEIILLDFSGIEPGHEFEEAVEEAASLIQAGEPNTALTLIDVTGSEFDLDMLEALKNLAVSDTPYVKASAVVGAVGLHEKAREAIARLSHRTFRKFDTREEAMEWLATM